MYSDSAHTNGSESRTAPAWPAAALILTVVVAAAALPASLHAAALAPEATRVQSTAEADDRWLPWIGCWTAGDGPLGGEATERVCVVPEEDGSGVELLTVEAGAVVGSTRIRADGQRHAIDEAGCTGWRRASWSADDRRVLIRSRLDCDGDVRRVSSEVIAMLDNAVWLDVHADDVDGEGPVLRTVRYRPAEAPATLRTRVESAVADREAARSAQRIRAARPLSLHAVRETVELVGAEAARGLILEHGTGFDLDGQALLDLADAGVPGAVTDLMIALSYPDRFEIRRGGSPALDRDRSLDAAGLASARRLGVPRYPMYDTRSFYRGCYGSAAMFHASLWELRRFERYGFGRCSIDRLRYGRSYGWSYGGPEIIVVRERPRDDDRSGRVVNGRGYTRGGAPQSAGPTAGDRIRTRSSATRDTSTRVDRDTGQRSGGSSTGRKAKRRTGGSDGGS